MRRSVISIRLRKVNTNGLRVAVHTIGQFQAEKDETDTELAMESALAYNPEQIILTGVTGGRLDHMESALHLLYRLQIEHPHTCISIRNSTNELSILRTGNHQLQPDEQLPYISFFPFGGDVDGLTLTGFKYETVDATVGNGHDEIHEQ